MGWRASTSAWVTTYDAVHMVEADGTSVVAEHVTGSNGEVKMSRVRMASPVLVAANE